MAYTIPVPADCFSDSRRHCFVFAHQDDEFPYGGLMQRAIPHARFVWLTNGDGLAPEEHADPVEYAATRRAETEAAMDVICAPRDELVFLEKSELTIFDRFVRMSTIEREVPKQLAYFEEMADEIYDEVKRADPDFVWTVAFQGGHPEHDLVHLMAVRAVRRLSRERRRPIRLFELPEYEFTFLVPLRYKPWRTEHIHEILLTPREVEAKLEMGRCYPSQEKIFDAFRMLLGTFGLLSIPFKGRPLTIEDYLGRETFSTINPDRIYTRSTHMTERLDYMFDAHQGVPITFGRVTRPIAAHLLGR